ncbi:MAG: ferrous iron transporter B [Clostridiales bacterium]|jgi:ferrous iron transport protein B|nr:ferrous iron transporter B [Clostridiales bacterium]
MKSGASRKIVFTAALAGNPNVGKSTVFNRLTGRSAHTGNWAGKTVVSAVGGFKRGNACFTVVDLPGAYSLRGKSADEAAAGGFIIRREADVIVAVADAGSLTRGVKFALEVASVYDPSEIILCVNLLDEARARGIETNLPKLSEMTGLTVIGASAANGEGIDELREAIARKCAEKERGGRERSLAATADPARIKKLCQTVRGKPDGLDRKIDKIILGVRGIPIMAALFGLILWITASGANLLSEGLTWVFAAALPAVRGLLEAAGAGADLTGFLCDGVLAVVCWVVSVMLPPMAIFFPLFTLLEDAGLLPRLAFNLDGVFKKAGAHGKQALTMCMGLGCNAAGVTACRIIDSGGERRKAVLTNVFTPCNGRFPLLTALTLIFFGGAARSVAAGFLAAAVSVGSTLLACKLISLASREKGASDFTLALPPYRRPRVLRAVAESARDKTARVLLRAVVAAAPAGALIWTLRRTGALDGFTAFLEPAGAAIGLDGVILAAFLLAFPANEIVLPVMLMCYSGAGVLREAPGLSELSDILRRGGWSAPTAACVMIFSICHFPCAATLATIFKETGSVKSTLLAAVLPTAFGAGLCAIVNFAARFV